MIWTADTVMYHDVSMDRAYSGSTLIWCKNCPIVPQLTEVRQGEPITKGTTYVIGNANSWNFLQPDYSTGSLSSAWNFVADADYPAVYESLCEGYVTDLGAAFGIAMGNTGTGSRYALVINSNNKQSLSAYIGYDWKTPAHPDRNVIMKNDYGLTAFHGTRDSVYFDLFPLPTSTSYETMYFYRIDYIYL